MFKIKSTHIIWGIMIVCFSGLALLAKTLTGAALVQPRLMDSTPLYLPLVTKPFMDTGETTRRISLSSDAAQGNGASTEPTISDDGRYVAFWSLASNLVEGDTNDSADIFVRDQYTGVTSRVSVSTDGAEANNGSSVSAISSDGRYVVFESWASSLVEGDTNNSLDIFFHDRQTGETTRVSVASDGTQGNNLSEYPSVSADGRYVAFFSRANNLVADDTNSVSDMFVHDRQTGETTRVSVASDGSEANAATIRGVISPDGRYVVFASEANNLVSDDTNGVGDIFLHDRQTGETSRVSVSADGTEGNGESYWQAISADNRYIAFGSIASNLVPNDTNDKWDMFLHDRQTGETRRVSVASDGTEGNGNCVWLDISPDGRYVTFASEATNLVDEDTNGVNDIFVHDWHTGQTTRVSVSADGLQSNGASANPAVSRNGLYVVYYSSASNLVADDTNAANDVFAFFRRD